MPTDQPNILWYCTDQQRFDTIGALGNPHVRTPNLDRFVGQSVAFTHAYCQSPICTPSRSSFLTGMYPSRVHNSRNDNESVPLETAQRLVTRTLADAGWDGGLVGKLHLAGAATAREPRAKDGYRLFEYSHAPRNDWPLDDHGYARWIYSKGYDPGQVLDVEAGFGGLMVPTANRDNVPPELHQSTWCTDRAIAFINEDRPPETPWFLSVNPYDPHPPYNPPWEYYRRYDPQLLPGPLFRDSDLETQGHLFKAGVDFQTTPQRPDAFRAKEVQAAYFAMIELIDAQFGRLLQALEASGQTMNTVVIYTSDHGESAGDHGLTQKGCRFFDGLTRVPLIWRGPGRFIAGHRCDALVELTDITPTLLEIAGLSVPGETQGRSLLSILQGGNPGNEHREHVRCEYLDAARLPGHSRATMYRNRQWKLNIYHNHGVGELYDMQADPHEFDNLWDSPIHRDVRDELLRASFDATVMATDPGPSKKTSC